jgi:CHAD domain-containing protein
MTALDILQREIAVVRCHYDGLRDGEHGSIHDARIATRRIRELLPLTYDWHRREHADELAAMVKRMGRSLGRVRDADVRIQLLQYLEARIPHAAPSLVLVRQREEHQRLLIMRKLVKRFERLGVERELAGLAVQSPAARVWFWRGRASTWREELRRCVEERAIAAADAVVHATGVYFPRRVHAARIAIKKFRYAAEIAIETGMLAETVPLRPLKKTQDQLGDLHDRQALIDQLRTTAASDPGVDAGHIALVEQVIEAEIADLHARYLRRRGEIHAACALIRGEVRRPRTAIRAAAIGGALAVATGFEAARRLGRRRNVAPPDAVAIRVAVSLPEPMTK